MVIEKTHLRRSASDSRSVNWLEHTAASIIHNFPEMKQASVQITDRLSSLLLERLPAQLGQELLELLPKSVLDHCSDALKSSANSDSDRSIGYPDFVQRAELTLGCLQYSPREYSPGQYSYGQLSEKIVDAFLWAIASDLPPDLKFRMSEDLPIDLRSRMDLYSAHSDDSKVA